MIEEIHVSRHPFGTILLGPCGDNFLHQQSIEAWFRFEDSQVAMHVVADIDIPRMDNKNKGNPSARRDGILITFWCEHCGGDLHTLAIIQDKGNTFMQWIDPSELEVKR